MMTRIIILYKQFDNRERLTLSDYCVNTNDSSSLKILMFHITQFTVLKTINKAVVIRRIDYLLFFMKELGTGYYKIFQDDRPFYR